MRQVNFRHNFVAKICNATKFYKNITFHSFKRKNPPSWESLVISFSLSSSRFRYLWICAAAWRRQRSTTQNIEVALKLQPLTNLWIPTILHFHGTSGRENWYLRWFLPWMSLQRTTPLIQYTKLSSSRHLKSQLKLIEWQRLKWYFRDP